jgi:hypothetical protein
MPKSKFAAPALFLMLAYAVPAAASLHSIDRGNGEGTAGSPPHIAYYWLDPSIQCPAGSVGMAKPGYRQAFWYSRPGYWMFEDACTEARTEIADGPDFEFGPAYLYGLAGYREGTYVLRGAPPKPGSAEVVRTWCRSLDANGRTGVDVVIRTYEDGKPLQASLWISTATGNPAPRDRHVWEVPAFGVAAQGPRFAAPDFELKISGDRADLTATVDDRAIVLPMRCRVTPE